MIPSSFAALEMLDQDPARPKNVELGLWLAELYKEDWTCEIKQLIRLMRWSGLPVPPGYDEELEQRSLSPARGFLLFEILEMITFTPERFQEALAWLLQIYLESDEEFRSQVLAFREFARSGFALGETALHKIFVAWRILQLKKSAKLELREIAHIFDMEGMEIFNLEKLAKAAGEPIESAADLWEEWQDETAISVAEGYMRLFHVEVPQEEEPADGAWEARWRRDANFIMPGG